MFKKNLKLFLLNFLFCLALQAKIIETLEFNQLEESNVNKNKVSVIQNKKKVISHIFVHGTVAAATCIFPFFFKQLRESNVYTTFMMLPEKGFFKLNLQKNNLEPFSQNLRSNSTQNLGATSTLSKFISSFRDIVSAFSKDKFEDLQFYAFGWEGVLSHDSRLQGGKDLYENILKLESTSDPGCENIVRLVAHSHGGNVCLNLAQVHKDRKNEGLPLLSKNTKLEIYMFGSPILKETELFAGSDIFNLVVNIHSEGDLVQGSDFFSTEKKSRQRINMSLFNHEQKKRIAEIKAVYCISDNLAKEIKINPGHAALFIPFYPFVKYPIALALPFIFETKDLHSDFYGDFELRPCIYCDKDDSYNCRLYQNEKLINSCDKNFPLICSMNDFFLSKRLESLKSLPFGLKTIGQFLLKKQLSN